MLGNVPRRSLHCGARTLRFLRAEAKGLPGHEKSRLHGSRGTRVLKRYFVTVALREQDRWAAGHGDARVFTVFTTVCGPCEKRFLEKVCAAGRNVGRVCAAEERWFSRGASSPRRSTLGRAVGVEEEFWPAERRAGCATLVLLHLGQPRLGERQMEVPHLSSGSLFQFAHDFLQQRHGIRLAA